MRFATPLAPGPSCLFTSMAVITRCQGIRPFHDVQDFKIDAACRIITCVASPTKAQDISPILCTNLRLEAPLPLYFSCTTFRNSAIAPATPSIQKRTTRRWTLRCSHYSVANQQQFAFPLRTAILSLKLEKGVAEGLILLFRSISK